MQVVVAVWIQAVQPLVLEVQVVVAQHLKLLLEVQALLTQVQVVAVQDKTRPIWVALVALE
jgi:hypothetical protein